MKEETKGNQHKTFLKEYCHLEALPLSPSHFQVKETDAFKGK